MKQYVKKIPTDSTRNTQQRKIRHLSNLATEDDTPPSFMDRLLTAILAPIAFNFSIIIVLSMFFGSGGARIFNRTRLIYQIPVDFILLIVILLPALAGFMMGMSKFTTFFGHFFYTNIRHERDIRKTIAAWICLFLIAYCISGVLV